MEKRQLVGMAMGEVIQVGTPKHKLFVERGDYGGSFALGDSYGVGQSSEIAIATVL